MKKMLTLGLLFMGLAATTMAQEQNKQERPEKKDMRKVRHERKMEKRTPEEIAKLKTEHLDKELKFTDAQRKEVYAIQLDQAQKHAVHRSEMKKLRDDWGKDMEGAREKMNSVLTPEQQELLKEKYTDTKNKREKIMRKKRPGRPERLLDTQKEVTEKVEG